MATNEETNAAGTDTRPPMLVESDYDSWKILVHQFSAVPGTEEKLDLNFKVFLDTSSTTSIKQALQRRFGIMWRCLCKDQVGLFNKDEDLLMSTNGFRAIGNNQFHDYFVRFHKLVNDMKITQLNIPTHQMNTKFVNNLPAYWGKYVTNVKQNMDISTTPYVQIYTHLKAYEPHAKRLSRNGAVLQFHQPTTQLRLLQLKDFMLRCMMSHCTEPIQSKLQVMLVIQVLVQEVICYKLQGEGHVASKWNEQRERWTLSTSKIKPFTEEAKEKGDVLIAEAKHSSLCGITAPFMINLRH
ncbi:hypothetical protein Tco_1312369 [Tanacetum coccineum]